MNYTSRGVCSLLCMAILALSGIAAQGAARQPNEVNVSEAAELIKKKPENLVILDVRTPAEFSGGHIPNARNMDFFGGSFDMDITKLPKDDTILVYCRSGKRSAGAAEILEEAGFKNVLHMADGMEKWEKAGLPVEK